MTETRRNYELAFHINPNLEESRIAEISNELKDQLTKHGATVTFTHEPERRKLSYPVRGNLQAYFGFIQFSLEKDSETNNEETALTSVDEYIKLNPDVIRSVVLRLPSDAKKNQAAVRQAKARERLEKQAQAAAKSESTEKPAVDSGKLDDELEDIIEKL